MFIKIKNENKYFSLNKYLKYLTRFSIIFIFKQFNVGKSVCF